MGRRRTVSEWIAIAAIGCAFGVDVSCLTFKDDHPPIPGPARALDDACRNGRCTLSGSAAFTTGPTADSIGVRLGPEEGAVTFVLPHDPLRPPNYTSQFQILLSGAGTFTAWEPTCNSSTKERSHTAPSDYGWLNVFDCQPDGDTSTTVTVQVEKGNVLDILDIRILDEHVSEGCSISGRHR